MAGELDRKSPRHADDAELTTRSESPLDANGRRRRKLVAGGTTAAVMVTLAGRPAWGSSCSPSAQASANLSGQHDYDTCASKSAGYWKVRERWSQLKIPLDPDADFHAFFGGSRFDNRTGDGLSLIQVINLTGSPRSMHIQFPGEDKILAPGGPYSNEHSIGLHAVGALVNSHAFPFGYSSGDFGFTTDQVIRIYNENDAYTAAAYFEEINNQFDYG